MVFVKKPVSPDDPNRCNYQFGGENVDFGYCHKHQEHFSSGTDCPQRTVFTRRPTGATNAPTAAPELDPEE